MIFDVKTWDVDVHITSNIEHPHVEHLHVEHQIPASFVYLGRMYFRNGYYSVFTL